VRLLFPPLPSFIDRCISLGQPSAPTVVLLTDRLRRGPWGRTCFLQLASLVSGLLSLAASVGILPSVPSALRAISLGASRLLTPAGPFAPLTSLSPPVPNL
jgi:hypothetical protein